MSGDSKASAPEPRKCVTVCPCGDRLEVIQRHGESFEQGTRRLQAEYAAWFPKHAEHL